MVDKRTPHVYVEFEAKFGELWATRTLRETWWTREQFTFMWNLRQNLESSGHQEKYKSHTSVGRKFAPVEGLSHDLVCTAIYLFILRGRCGTVNYHPVLNLINSN